MRERIECKEKQGERVENTHANENRERGCMNEKLTSVMSIWRNNKDVVGMRKEK
jgi:hypothetical protein